MNVFNARRLVACRRRHEREATDHRALHDEVEGTQPRRRALSLQDLEVVAMVRWVLVAVALGDDARDRLADGSAPAPVGIAPRQAVCLPGVLMIRCAYW
jgi:hypothetical protein